MTVTGAFTARGGITTTVVAEYIKPTANFELRTSDFEPSNLRTLELSNLTRLGTPFATQRGETPRKPRRSRMPIGFFPMRREMGVAKIAAGPSPRRRRLDSPATVARRARGARSPGRSPRRCLARPPTDVPDAVRSWSRRCSRPVRNGFDSSRRSPASREPLARAPEYRLPLAMLEATADILPHQLEPALAVIAGHTRLLLADDVGLGKTIQAGLVVSELCRRQSAPRVLLVVPSSLREQWRSELGQRFAIECMRADRRELEARSADGAFGANPWQRAGVWLVSTDFLKQAHVLDMLPRDAWDLVVIDEAHGVCGDSDRYRACHDVARRSRRVLLLTATPHSGDAARFARLAGLGASDDGPAPLVFRRTRADLGIQRPRRVSWQSIRLSDAESRALGALLEFERAALRSADQNSVENTRLLLSVFRKRALSTFTALSLSLAKRLLWLGDEDPGVDAGWTQPSLAFDADDDESRELPLLTLPIGLDRRHERAWLRRLRQLADDAARSESKIARLKSLLERTAEPVVIFSEFRDSLEAIESGYDGAGRLPSCTAVRMRGRSGPSSAVILAARRPCCSPRMSPDRA